MCIQERLDSHCQAPKDALTMRTVPSVDPSRLYQLGFDSKTMQCIFGSQCKSFDFLFFPFSVSPDLLRYNWQINYLSIYIYLSYIVWWFDVCKHCATLTTIKPVDVLITSILCVWWENEDLVSWHSSSIYLLIMITELYIRFLGLTHFVAGRL